MRESSDRPVIRPSGPLEQQSDASSETTHIQSRNEVRATRKLLSSLESASSLVAVGDLSKAEYGALVIDTVDRLTRGEVRSPDHKGRRIYEPMRFQIYAADAFSLDRVWPDLDIEGSKQRFGDYMGAFHWVYEALHGDVNFHQVTDIALELNEGAEKLLRSAQLRLKRIHRSLGRIETSLTELRERYPNVSRAAASVALALLSAILGLLVGIFAM